MPDPDFIIRRDGSTDAQTPQTDDIAFDAERPSPGVSALVLQLVTRLQVLEGQFSAERRDKLGEIAQSERITETLVIDGERAQRVIDRLTKQVENLSRIASDAINDTRFILDALDGTSGVPALPGGDTTHRRQVKAAAVRIFNNVGGISRARPIIVE